MPVFLKLILLIFPHIPDAFDDDYIFDPLAKVRVYSDGSFEFRHPGEKWSFTGSQSLN